jgi:ATP-binding cassette, subfamily B, bacterial MsbA
VKEVWRILGLAGRYRPLLPFLVSLEVIAALAESFGVGLLIPFTEAVFGESTFGGMQGPLLRILALFGKLTGTEGRPLLIGGFIIAFIVAKTLLWGAYIGASQWIKEKAVHEARCRILGGLLSADYGAFGKRDISDYHNAIASESWRAAEAISSFFLLLGRGAVVLVFAVILALLSWKLLVFSIAVFGAASLLVQRFSQISKAQAERAWSSNWRLSSRVLSVLAGMRTVRLFRQEARELDIFSTESERTRRAYFFHSVFSGLVGPILEMIYIPFFVLLVLASHLAGMQMSVLIAFLVLAYRVVPHMRATEEARIGLASGLTHLRKMIALLDEFPVPPQTDEKPRAPFQHEIVFDHVGFGYEREDHGTFSVTDISFTIPRGSTIALVGASGSGKSTLVNLLLGFYRPREGEIRVDGIGLDALDMASWRRLIGFAGQDSQLFPGSIAENIAYGRPGASRAEIEAVAARANVTEFIGRFPRGLDAEIAREGLDLSGGQRQRIALARALLIDPEILLLDEATNALDNVTEATIQHMLAELAHKTTTIIVAHRMSTIRHADWIIALDRGHIAEQGRPADLLRKNAAFARLYKLEAEIAFANNAQAE